jgi:hypothetical protein
MIMRGFYNSEQAALKLGISMPTFRRYISLGLVPISTHRLGSRHYWRAADIDALAAGGLTPVARTKALARQTCELR